MIVIWPWFRVFLKAPFRAICLFPFIVLTNAADAKNKPLLQHERIHFRQQLELLVVFFYLFYLAEYLFHRIKGRDKISAYLHISFEKEAYRFEKKPDYLKNRKTWAMWRRSS